MSDLIVLSLERWDSVWRRNQYLVAGLLDADPDLRVLFVEPADDPLHDLRSRRNPSTGAALRQIDERLWTSRPVKWLPRRLDRAADSRLSRAVQRAAGELGMQAPLLWINDPRVAHIARDTCWPVLYDITDDWLTADRSAAELSRIATGEAWLLTHAETVVACSPELIRRKASLRTDITLVRNGVETERYLTPAPRPLDLPPAPYALYVGTLHRDRLDVGLCEQTASALLETGRLVLVGPDALHPEDSRRLRAAGAIVLGARQRELVPAYLQHADVLVVPHVVNAFTESLDPIKLYEYQAVGRSIVSTPVAGFRGARGVHVAEGAAFVDAVLRGIPAKTRFPDGVDVSAPDWSARVAQFRDLLAH